MTCRPLRFAGLAAKQTDATACGPASLLYLAALGDPTLRRWLDGQQLAANAALLPEVPGWARTLPPELRQEIAQRTIRAQLRAGIWRWWPPALGTNPYAAARLARYRGVRFRVQWLSSKQSFQRLYGALAGGIPALFYVGGAPGESCARRMPRHVVVVRCVGKNAVEVYEPAGANLFELDASALKTCENRAAFGGWNQPYAAVIGNGAT